jgi:hypothetical protein
VDLRNVTVQDRRSFLWNTGAMLGGLSLIQLLGCVTREQTASTQQSLPTIVSAPYTGFIIVRLSARPNDALRLNEATDLRTLAKQANASALEQLLSRYSQVESRRLVTGITPSQIGQLEARAAQRGASSRDSLTLYWRLDARRVEDAQQLLDQLKTVPLVDLAYREVSLAEPAVDTSNDPHAAQQRHLDAAPTGIDARWAWTLAGGTGAGVGFVDVEQGWLLAQAADPTSVQHEDLPSVKSFPGVPRLMNSTCFSKHHGTAVASLVAGLDNDKGVIGVAPGLAWIDVASLFTGGPSSGLADAIYSIVGHMTEGDVLLIESQDGFNRPVETDNPVVWKAIDTATALGIIVIEPAGNGNLDLDAVSSLNRNPGTDSHAVIVGACESQLDSSGTGHDRWIAVPSDFVLPGPVPPYLQNCYATPPTMPGSNFGSCVDCHAWGKNVVAAGYGWLGGNAAINSYTNRFGGTSAAAAIVAGAAVVIQGLHRAVRNMPLTPLQMRNVLSSYGTPQGAGVAGHIGVMPNLRQAAMGLNLVSTSPRSPSNVRVID